MIEYVEFIGFTDYKKLILYLAGKWYKNLWIDIEEAIALGNYSYCLALKNYKHNRIPFASYLTQTIEWGYKNYYNKNKERKKTVCQFIENCRADMKIKHTSDLKFNSSKDANIVIDIVLYRPKGYKQIEKNNHSRKRAIRMYLRKFYDWDNYKIDKVFDEIKENL
jgi:hypothetical protein